MARTLRERRRYILFEVVSEGEIERKGLLKAIWDSVYSLFGDKGASEGKIWLVEFDNSTDIKRGILGCVYKKVEEVRAALACVSSVGEARVGIRVVRTSGTIKGTRRKRNAKKAENRAFSG